MKSCAPSRRNGRASAFRARANPFGNNHYSCTTVLKPVIRGILPGGVTMARYADYEVLGRYLAAQHKTLLPMTFSEVARVVGQKLPNSEKYPAWGSNDPSDNPMTRVWLEAGFKTEQVDTTKQRLVFRRVRQEKSDEPHGEPGTVVTSPRKTSSDQPPVSGFPDVASGRLPLSMDRLAWFERLLEIPGVRLAGISPRILVGSSFLPGRPPHDPMDRIIIAIAREGGYRLVTRDKHLLAYADEGHVQALAC